MDPLHDAPRLKALCHDVFRRAGHDLWLVGGVVRSRCLGVLPKDLDLCTSAEPDEQVRLYRAAGIRYVETGLAHGTLTVILPGEQPYEITSLRADEKTDGRHAKPRYGVDLLTDLSRRDLTYNAMAMTFEGEVIDPHGGQADLAAGRTRFVGRALDRMQEDYLRILRFVRFHGQITSESPFDDEASAAIAIAGKGLARISTERIWSEVSRIVVAPSGPSMIGRCLDLGLAPHMRLPDGSLDRLREAHAGFLAWQELGQPAAPAAASALLGAFLADPGATEALSHTWRWSLAERQEGVYVARHLLDRAIDLRREAAVGGNTTARVARLAAMQGRFEEAKAIAGWCVPSCPARGQDLIDRGLAQGRHLGPMVRQMVEAWAESDYRLGKDELLDLVLTRKPA